MKLTDCSCPLIRSIPFYVQSIALEENQSMSPQVDSNVLGNHRVWMYWRLEWSKHNSSRVMKRIFLCNPIRCYLGIQSEYIWIHNGLIEKGWDPTATSMDINGDWSHFGWSDDHPFRLIDTTMIYVSLYIYISVNGADSWDFPWYCLVQLDRETRIGPWFNFVRPQQ